MAQSVQIKEYKKQDGKIAFHLKENFLKKFVGLSRICSSVEMSKNFKKNPGFVLFAYQGKIVIGYIAARVKEGSAHIYDFYLKENNRETAKALLKELFKRCKEKGIDAVTGEVSPGDNIRRIAYQKAGCVVISNGQVNMVKVRDVKRLLKKILPLLNERIKRAFLCWEGGIRILINNKKEILLQVSNKKVALPKILKKAKITISGSHETFTRVFLGKKSMEMAYRDAEMDIKPGVDTQLLFLLSNLFPLSPWLKVGGW